MIRRVSVVGGRSAVAAAAPWIMIAVAFGLAFGVAYVVIRPLSSTPVGYDTAGSVLYFQRIIHGVPLEQVYGVTPKPLITLVDGVLFTLGAWRAVSLFAVLCWAATAALGTELCRRLGGLPAAGFALVALIGSRPLMLDASLAYAVGMACVWLLVAGLALARERPLYVLAGASLCLATLARLEAIVVVVGAVLIAGLAEVLALVRRTRPVERRAWWLALGLLAIPVMMVHDWLLIRDPMYWMKVAATYAAAYPRALQTPLQTSQMMVGIVLQQPLALVLAVLGGTYLAVARRWVHLAGLSLAWIGIFAFLVFLSARSTYVSYRYAFVPLITMSLLAAIGVGALELPTRWARFERIRDLRRIRLAGGLLGLLLGGVVAYVATVPFGPLDQTTRAVVGVQQTTGQNLLAATPVIRAHIPAGTGRRSPLVLAPGLWTPRLLVDLGLRINDVVDLRFSPNHTKIDPSSLRAGELVYHDRAADPANRALARLEAGGTVRQDAWAFVPVAEDRRAGWWLFKVEVAP